MKKLPGMFLICLVFALGGVVGCTDVRDNGGNTDAESTKDTFETVAPETSGLETIIDETADIETTVPVNEEPYTYKMAKQIIDAIKSGDYKTVAGYMEATDVEAYKFIKNMKVDSCGIVETRKEGEYSDYFKIKFNISKSDNEYFTVGESYWDLIITDSMVAIPLFRPSDEKISNPYAYANVLKSDKGYNFCYSFSAYLGITETADDFNTVINTVKAPFGWGTLHNIIHYYMFTASDSHSTPTAKIAEEYMIKTTGITCIDYTDNGLYNTDDFNLICVGHGGDSLFWSPVSKEYDDVEEVNTVVINYYADSALLVVAKTVEYKYTLNDDGTFRMLSTELLYDSGYRIKGLSV